MNNLKFIMALTYDAIMIYINIFIIYYHWSLYLADPMFLFSIGEGMILGFIMYIYPFIVTFISYKMIEETFTNNKERRKC